jgi:hypothetical protein
MEVNHKSSGKEGSKENKEREEITKFWDGRK